MRTDFRPNTDAEERLCELILHIAWACRDDSNFGAVRLNKTLYNSDFHSYRHCGSPITGVTYMRLQKGPAPVPLVTVRERMVKNHDLYIEIDPYDQFAPHKFVPLRRPNRSLFEPDEIAIVDEWICRHWGKSGEEVSEESHGIVWKIYGNKQFIPYELAFISDEPVTAYDVERTHQLAKELGWTLW